MALFGRMNSLAPMCFMGAATPKTAKAMIIIAVASSLCFGCPTGICWPGPSLPWFWRSSARTPSSHRPSSQGGLARLFVFGALYASEFFVIHPANRAGPSSVCFTAQSTLVHQCSSSLMITVAYAFIDLGLGDYRLCESIRKIELAPRCAPRL
jgi:hypothetical protein